MPEGAYADVASSKCRFFEQLFCLGKQMGCATLSFPRTRCRLTPLACVTPLAIGAWAGGTPLVESYAPIAPN